MNKKELGGVCDALLENGATEFFRAVHQELYKRRKEAMTRTDGYVLDSLGSIFRDCTYVARKREFPWKEEE